MRNQDSRYHVLMIAPTSFFADYGCHIRILEEALVLRRLGHKVTIVTYYKGRAIADLDIVRTPPLPWRADYEVGSSRHKIAFDTYLSFTVLSRLSDSNPISSTAIFTKGRSSARRSPACLASRWFLIFRGA